MAILVFLSFPIATIADSHIKVDLISDFGSGIVSKAVHAIGVLIGFSIFTALTVQLWSHSQKLKRYDQVTNSLEIPLYLIGFVATACCFLCVVVMLIRSLTKLPESPQ